jgi:hypothetical protein
MQPPPQRSEHQQRRQQHDPEALEEPLPRGNGLAREHSIFLRLRLRRYRCFLDI